MKKFSFLLLPLFLALLMVTGLSVFFDAQNAQAAPSEAPILRPAAGPTLQITPTVTETFYLGDEFTLYVEWDRSGCGVFDSVDSYQYDTGDSYLVGWVEKWTWSGNFGYEQPGYLTSGGASSAFKNYHMYETPLEIDGDDIVWYVLADEDSIVPLVNSVSSDWVWKGNHIYSSGRHDPGTYNFSIGDWWYCSTGSAEVEITPILLGVPPEADCIDDYTIQDVITETIVMGDDDDGNEHTLVEGDYYYIATSGGPWNDGTNDRYDLAASWDRVDWEPLEGFSASTCDVFSSTEHLTYTQMFFSAISTTFYIRVNDTGVFTDNTGSMTYTLSTATYSPTVEVGCDDYFTYDEVDDWIASEIVYANVQNGTDLPIVVTRPDEWYLLETTAGPWADTGQGPSYETDFTRHWSALGTATNDWELMASDNISATAACIIELEDGHVQYYFNGEMFFEYYGIRVHDQDDPEDYGDNSGSMGYNLYSVEIEYPPEPCEALFTNPIPVPPMMAIYPDRPNGYEWSGWSSDEWYLLESRGGPWNDGPTHTNYFYDLQMSDDGGDSWYDFANYPHAGCVAYKDDNHPRIYIKPISGYSYWFRVKDQDDPNDFTDNSLGPMYIDFSTVEFGGVNPGDTCDDFSVGSEIISDTVSANDYFGHWLTGDASHPDLIGMYALETWGGPWYDGANDIYTYTAQLTQDGFWASLTRQYSRLDEFPGALCVEDVGDHYVRIFFRANPEQGYLIRANSTWHEWPITPNSGNFGYALSHVEYEPIGSCEADYTHLSYPIESGQIYAHLENGIRVGDVLSGTTDAILPANTYRLDVFGGPWNDGSSDLYDTDISDDGGDTWQPFDEFADSLCFNEGADENGYWGHQYFESDGTQAYRLRVHDTGVYSDNTDAMLYMLHSVEFEPDLKDPEDIPGWAMGCYETCYRPGSILQVPSWLEYGRCELMRWLSWCPWHTYALQNLQAEFMTREPFASAYAMVNVVNQVEAEVNSYEWGGECGVGGYGSVACEGGGDSSVLDGLEVFATLPQDSPYNGGSIDLFPATSTTPYGIFCQHQMIQVVGSRMATGICWGMNVVDQIGYLAWMQLIYDLSVTILFVWYVYARFLKK